MGRHKEKETAASAGQGERPEQTDADLLTPGSRIPSLQDRERKQLRPRPPSLGYLFTAAHASAHDSPAGIQQTKQQGHMVLRGQPPGSQSRGGQSTNGGSGGGGEGRITNTRQIIGSSWILSAELRGLRSALRTQHGFGGWSRVAVKCFGHASKVVVPWESPPGAVTERKTTVDHKHREATRRHG